MEYTCEEGAWPLGWGRDGGRSSQEKFTLESRQDRKSIEKREEQPRQNSQSGDNGQRSEDPGPGELR